MKSRCPHCASSYDIPEAALAAADGVVRCGNCMQLFDAEKNQVPPEPEQNDTALSELQEITPSEVNELLEASFDEDDLDSPPTDTTKDSFNEEELEFNSFSSDDHVTEYDRPIDQASEAESLETQEPEDEVVETVSLQQKLRAAAELIEDTEESSAESLTTNAKEELNEDNEPEETKDLILQEPEMETLVAKTSESAEDLVSELNFDDLAQDSLRQDESDSEISEAEQQRIEPKLKEHVSFGFDTHSAIDLDDHYVSESSESNEDNLNPNLLNRVGLSLAASLVTAVLAAQWMLAYNLLPQTNSGLLLKVKDTACRYLYCDVNLQKNVAQNYQSIDLLVQSHPTEKDALVLKTTLLNRSDRTLPYPRLAVEFSDLSNQVTAARVFTPEDYLNDQLLSSSSKGFSTNQPIEIELEFADPGAKAVNYSLHFLPSNG